MHQIYDSCFSILVTILLFLIITNAAHLKQQKCV